MCSQCRGSEDNMIPHIDPYYNIIAVHVLMSIHTIIINTLIL